MAKKTKRTKSSIHQRASTIRKKESAIKSKKETGVVKKNPVKMRRISEPTRRVIPRTITKVVHKKTRETGVEKKLVENFIALQKVMVNLSTKFDNLTNQISKLLELFEISAKSLAKKDFRVEKDIKDEGKIMQKLDSLAGQNRTIARGLTLMHDRISGSGQERPVQRPAPTLQPRPAMRPPVLPPEQRIPPGQGPGTPGMEGYQKSASSKPTQFKKLNSSSEKLAER